MVFITSEEYRDLLEIKFKYELSNKPTYEFKVGDKARFIISNKSCNNGFTIGETVKILETGLKNQNCIYDISIQNDEGYVGYVDTYQLEREEN